MRERAPQQISPEVAASLKEQLRERTKHAGLDLGDIRNQVEIKVAQEKIFSVRRGAGVQGPPVPGSAFRRRLGTLGVAGAVLFAVPTLAACEQGDALHRLERENEDAAKKAKREFGGSRRYHNRPDREAARERDAEMREKNGW